MFVATVMAWSRPAWATISGLPEVLLGVEDLVRDALLVEQAREVLGRSTEAVPTRTGWPVS